MWYEAERVKGHRKANNRIQMVMNEAKKHWIGNQCEEMEICLNKTIARERITWLRVYLQINRVGPELSKQVRKMSYSRSRYFQHMEKYYSELYNHESEL